MTPADERKARAEDVLEEVYLHLNPDDRVSIITAAIAAAERAEKAKWMRFTKRQADSYERMRPLCPDHIDKQQGKGCLACRIEKAERAERERCAKLAEQFHADLWNNDIDSFHMSERWGDEWEDEGKAIARAIRQGDEEGRDE